MEIDRSRIVDLLRVRGEYDHASHAERELPVVVDTKRDKELLASVGLDEQAIVGGMPDVEGGSADPYSAPDDGNPGSTFDPDAR